MRSEKGQPVTDRGVIRSLVRHRPYGFTLIELVLVSTLLVVIVGIAVVRLDGFSDQGRLRSAGRQIGMLYRTARFQALTDGRPRMIEYVNSAESGARVRIHTPTFQGGDVEWRAGEGFVLASGVRVERVERGQASGLSERLHPAMWIWMGSDGIAPSHLAVLALRGAPRAAVVIDGVTGEDQLVWIDDARCFDPQALLEPTDATDGPDAR